MAERPWSERHIIELIKKNGGGGGLAAVGLPVFQKQGGQVWLSARSAALITGDQGTSGFGSIYGFYMTLDQTECGVSTCMPVSDFGADGVIMAVAWPNQMNGRILTFPYATVGMLTQELKVVMNRSNGVDQMTGVANFKFTQVGFQGYTFSTASGNATYGGQYMEGPTGGKVYVAIQADDTLKNLGSAYKAQYGVDPTFVHIYHKNFPDPV